MPLYVIEREISSGITDEELTAALERSKLWQKYPNSSGLEATLRRK